MGTDIVVGIDGSEHSAAALRWAVDEAALRGVRVRAVLAWSFLGQGHTNLGVGTTDESARAELDRCIADVAGEQAGLVDPVTINDLPVPALLEQAKDAALVVVGSRGVGGVKGLLQGSTSRTVVERSPVPVVVVHPPRA
jgi:nucleotide-binding universal stress UspA family protein